MRQYNIATLVQIMACRLFGAKPLSPPMVSCCQLDPKEHISVKFHLKFKSFNSRKCTWKCRLQNGGHIVSASMCYTYALFVLCCVLLWLSTDQFYPNPSGLLHWQLGIAPLIAPVPLTHLPLDKMAAISQTIFSGAFSWMKSFVFWLKFHWNLFQLTISQHWFR